jgi:hypothetical protein
VQLAFGNFVRAPGGLPLSPFFIFSASLRLGGFARLPFPLKLCLSISRLRAGTSPRAAGHKFLSRGGPKSLNRAAACFKMGRTLVVDHSL